MYFDKDGSPLSLMQWAKKFEDFAYKRIAETALPNGKRVSTVWLGVDHNFFPGGPPLFFETMVFSARDVSSELDILDLQRYSTEAEAVKGHQAMVEKWLAQKETP